MGCFFPLLKMSGDRHQLWSISPICKASHEQEHQDYLAYEVPQKKPNKHETNLIPQVLDWLLCVEHCFKQVSADHCP